eukprot:1633209-Amphidinium_carterae.1
MKVQQKRGALRVDDSKFWPGASCVENLATKVHGWTLQKPPGNHPVQKLQQQQGSCDVSTTITKRDFDLLTSQIWA